ncbi:hypothetical protein ACQP3J_26975 [Escherichia coli]
MSGHPQLVSLGKDLATGRHVATTKTKMKTNKQSEIKVKKDKEEKIKTPFPFGHTALIPTQITVFTLCL